MYCELKYIKHQTKGFFNDLTLKLIIPNMIIAFILAVTAINYFNDKTLMYVYITLNLSMICILYYKAYKYCRK